MLIDRDLERDYSYRKIYDLCPDCMKKLENFLKVRHTNDRFIEWWNNLTDEEKDIIKLIPNFDPDKFFEITGIRVED